MPYGLSFASRSLAPVSRQSFKSVSLEVLLLLVACLLSLEVLLPVVACLLGLEVLLPVVAVCSADAERLDALWAVFRFA